MDQEASSDGGGSAEQSSSVTVDDQASRIKKILGHDGVLTSKLHIRAVDALVELQRALLDGANASRDASMALMLTAVSLQRRLVRLRHEVARITYYGDATAAGSSVEQLRADEMDGRKTLTLVFVALTAADAATRGAVVDADDAEGTLHAAGSSSVWDQLMKYSSKRKAPPDEIELNERNRIELEGLCEQPFAADRECSRWSVALARPGLVAAAALRVASTILRSTDLGRLEELSTLFANATAEQLQSSLLQTRCDFSSLALGRITDEERINTIQVVISAAESEFGQSVLRDVVSSFLLPASVVGRRRTLLMSRETSDLATKEYPHVAAVAHGCAMAGAAYTWERSTSELKKSAALLSGLALLTTRGTDDVARKATAFNSLVQLPFLETPPPQDRERLRLALVTASRTWVLYRLDASGRPILEFSSSGLSGLVEAIVLLRR